MFFSKLAKQTQPIWIFCDGGAGEVITLGERSQEAGKETGRRTAKVTLQAGCGAVARNDQGEILQWTWRTLSPMTNNEAEYAGLLLGVELAMHMRLRNIVCVLDSSVVVLQMQGRAAVNSPSLRTWHRKAVDAIRPFDKVEFRLIPRELNYLADSLTWQARQPWQVTKEWLMVNGE
ncbi:MAG: ribonuclease HI family protein [Caldilineaceae bacterium]